MSAVCATRFVAMARPSVTFGLGRSGSRCMNSGERLRRVMYRDDAVSVTLPQAKRAKLGLAKPSRICQHGIEYRLQIAG